MRKQIASCAFLFMSSVAAFTENATPLPSVTLKTLDRLYAQIETQDLILNSVEWKHFENYKKLYADPIAIEKYKDGMPWEEEKIRNRLAIWIGRWETFDPYSAFAVYLKEGDRPFIGHIVLGHTAVEGMAELALLFHPEYADAYVQQAIGAIISAYAPSLIENGYLVNVGSKHRKPAPLSVIHATVRVDNLPYSEGMRLFGMQPGVIETLDGAERIHYTIKMD